MKTDVNNYIPEHHHTRSECLVWGKCWTFVMASNLSALYMLSQLRGRGYLRYFTDEEIGVQRGDAIFQRSHSECFEEPVKELRSVWVQILTHNHHLYHLLSSTPSLAHSQHHPFPWKPPPHLLPLLSPLHLGRQEIQPWVTICGSVLVPVVYLGQVSTHL